MEIVYPDDTDLDIPGSVLCNINACQEAYVLKNPSSRDHKTSFFFLSRIEIVVSGKLILYLRLDCFLHFLCLKS